MVRRIGAQGVGGRWLYRHRALRGPGEIAFGKRFCYVGARVIGEKVLLWGGPQGRYGLGSSSRRETNRTCIN